MLEYLSTYAHFLLTIIVVLNKEYRTVIVHLFLCTEVEAIMVSCNGGGRIMNRFESCDQQDNEGKQITLAWCLHDTRDLACEKSFAVS